VIKKSKKSFNMNKILVMLLILVHLLKKISNVQKRKKKVLDPN